MLLVVRGEVRGRGEPAFADLTVVRLLAGVYPEVHLQRGRLRELLAAGEARVGLLSGVRPHVLLQVLVSGELALTHRAG